MTYCVGILNGDTEPSRLLTVNATASMLSLGRSSIYAMLEDGRLQGIRLSGRTLVRRTSVDALIETAPAFSSLRGSR